MDSHVGVPIGREYKYRTLEHNNAVHIEANFRRLGDLDPTLNKSGISKGQM